MKELLTSYANGKLVGYTARIIKDYENVQVLFIGSTTDTFIILIRLYKDRKYIIITEGVLDVLAIDPKPFRNKLTQGQIDLINSIGKLFSCLSQIEISQRKI